MMQYLDPDFQRRLDEFNQSRGGPSHIAVAWDSKKNRWRIWAIPVQDSHHPLAKNDLTNKMSRIIPDNSGRWGIALNLWQGPNGEYEPMDERLFDSLRLADSFASKDHFEKHFGEPATALELAQRKRIRDIVAGAKSYWWALDKLTIGMNPAVKAPGDWRHRYR